MKPSRYNKFFEIGNGLILAYNTLSGALAHLTLEQYKKVQDILARCSNLQGDGDESDAYRTFLLESRFLIDDDVDELDILKTRWLLGTLMQDKLGLTIMPTLNCNFRCIYCYLEHRSKKMSREIRQNLIDWVKFAMFGHHQRANSTI
jgi:uncharacterized protein